MKAWVLGFAGLVAASTVGSSAYADPCEAPLPRRGQTFTGPVTYVGDGDSLCVAVGMGPGHWVEVRVADFYAPELSTSEGRRAKAMLERLAKGRQVTCKAEHRSYDRIVAVCRINGVSIARLMRQAGAPEGGNR